MTFPLALASCAWLPASQLARLGALRAREDVLGLIEAGSLWVFWDAPDAELAAWLLSLPGAELLCRGPDGWHAPGRHLPIFEVPDPERGKTFASRVFPAPVAPEAPGDAGWQPLQVRLVRDDRPRPAAALLSPLTTLVAWAESATSHALAGLTGARYGDLLLVRGSLPALPGERFWGRRVLVPAGYRTEPPLREEVLSRALRLGDGEIALLTHEGADVVPASAFGPMTRAGLRLAAEGAPHAG
jgi:hypothetical protein